MGLITKTAGEYYEGTQHGYYQFVSFYDIIKSDWYEKTLIESWEKTHHLHLPRCYLSCGDFAKRKVIK